MEAEQTVDKTNDEIFITPERQVPERSVYQANPLNIGYDNVPVNSGNNAPNIQRVDATYGPGIITSSPAMSLYP
jgi:hypothetical protein